MNVQLNYYTTPRHRSAELDYAAELARLAREMCRRQHELRHQNPSTQKGRRGARLMPALKAEPAAGGER
jgi:hypothetical protein